MSLTKEAQLSLDGAREKLQNATAGAGDKLSDFMEQAGPVLSQYKGPALAAIIGALLGGGAGALTSHDDSQFRNALQGGLLGGLAGGAGGLGYGFLTGKTLLPGEEPTSGGIIERAAGATSNAALSNAGTLGLGGAGLLKAWPNLPLVENYRRFIGDKDIIVGETTNQDGVTVPLKRSGQHELYKIPAGSPGERRRLAALSRKIRELGGPRGPSRTALLLPAAGLGAGFLLDQYLEGKV